MTKRERYLKVLQKEKADALSWVPNFDHWLNVNMANHTVPIEYRGMTRNDIVRAVDATIWSRVSMLHEVHPNVEIEREEVAGEYLRTTFKTPVGSVQTLNQFAKDSTRALFLKEHMIKTVKDIKVVQFIVEDTQYSMDIQPFLQSEREVGEDGVSLVNLPICFPYIQFGKTDAGWERGIYLWYDHQGEVESLMEAYRIKAEEAACLLAKSPAQIISCGDNMDEWTTPPNIFKRYALDFYQRIANILHKEGKIFQVHWCGRTGHLLPFVSQCGIDVVEAVTVQPMDKLTIPKALELAGDQVVIQGGVPSIMMCPQGGSKKQLEEYLTALVCQVPLGYRFVLGMSDNVPPDADFSRVKMISDIVNSLKN